MHCLVAVYSTSAADARRRDEDAEEEEEDEAAAGGEMYVKYDARLHGPRVPGRQPPLTVHFLKKFLTIVKRRCRCSLYMFFMVQTSATRLALHTQSKCTAPVCLPSSALGKGVPNAARLLKWQGKVVYWQASPVSCVASTIPKLDL